MPIPGSRRHMVGITLATILVLVATALLILANAPDALAIVLVALFGGVAALLAVGLLRDLVRTGRRPG